LVGKTKRGKGTKIMALQTAMVFLLALRTESASPAEVKLVEPTLEERVVADVPERLIGDKAYDSDRLDQALMQNYGTEMIAPTGPNGQRLRMDVRCTATIRRWKIERLFAWLFNFRRLVVRYEYHAETPRLCLFGCGHHPLAAIYEMASTADSGFLQEKAIAACLARAAPGRPRRDEASA